MIDRPETGVMLKTALRAIVDKYGFTMVCTPNQSVLFKDIKPEQREGVEAILTSYGIKSIEQVYLQLCADVVAAAHVKNSMLKKHLKIPKNVTCS